MQIDSIKSAIIKVLKRYPISRASIFGSFARNEANKDSDIDLLIESNKPITLFDILSLEKELSEVTSRKIDIVEFSAIKSSIRENILKEAIPVL
jgi:predicted nucleotidyltransferase